MKRRTLLRCAGGALAAATAGCVGDGGDAGVDGSDAGDGGDGTPTPTTAAGPPPTATATRTPTRTTTTATPTSTAGGPERTPHTGSAPLAPGVTDRTVTDEGSCSDGDGTAAAVAFEANAVVVTGHFSTPVPCFTVDVTDARYGDGTYEVALVPDRMRSGGDPTVCRQCLGRVAYEVRIEFESPPDTVVVRHGGETVARADR